MVPFSGKGQEREISSVSCRTVDFTGEQYSISCAHWPLKGRIAFLPPLLSFIFALLTVTLCTAETTWDHNPTDPSTGQRQNKKQHLPKELALWQAEGKRLQEQRESLNIELMMISSALRLPKSQTNSFTCYTNPLGNPPWTWIGAASHHLLLTVNPAQGIPPIVSKNHVCLLVSDCGATFISQLQKVFLCNRRPRSMSTVFFF